MKKLILFLVFSLSSLKLCALKLEVENKSNYTIEVCYGRNLMSVLDDRCYYHRDAIALKPNTKDSFDDLVANTKDLLIGVVLEDEGMNKKHEEPSRKRVKDCRILPTSEWEHKALFVNLTIENLPKGQKGVEIKAVLAGGLGAFRKTIIRKCLVN